MQWPCGHSTQHAEPQNDRRRGAVRAFVVSVDKSHRSLVRRLRRPRTQCEWRTDCWGLGPSTRRRIQWPYRRQERQSIAAGPAAIGVFWQRRSRPAAGRGCRLSFAGRAVPYSFRHPRSAAMCTVKSSRSGQSLTTASTLAFTRERYLAANDVWKVVRPRPDLLTTPRPSSRPLPAARRNCSSAILRPRAVRLSTRSLDSRPPKSTRGFVPAGSQTSVELGSRV